MQPHGIDGSILRGWTRRMSRKDQPKDHVGNLTPSRSTIRGWTHGVRMPAPENSGSPTRPLRCLHLHGLFLRLALLLSAVSSTVIPACCHDSLKSLKLWAEETNGSCLEVM